VRLKRKEAAAAAVGAAASQPLFWCVRSLTNIVYAAPSVGVSRCKFSFRCLNRAGEPFRSAHDPKSRATKNILLSGGGGRPALRQLLANLRPGLSD